MSPDQLLDDIAARQCSALFSELQSTLGGASPADVWNVLRRALKSLPPPAPLAFRIALNVAIDPETGCHTWLRQKNRDGYGFIWVDGKHRHTHRVAYELAKGPIPPAFVVDHLCRNTSCCNPAHLEAVTHAENVRRGFASRRGHCVQGHKMTGSDGHGRLTCLQCAREKRRKKAAEDLIVI